MSGRCAVDRSTMLGGLLLLATQHSIIAAAIACSLAADQ
jgi:hypothetical protein